MWSGQTYQLVLEEARTGEHVSASCVKPILPNSPWLQNSKPNRLKNSDYNHLFFFKSSKKLTLLNCILLHTWQEAYSPLLHFV